MTNARELFRCHQTNNLVLKWQSRPSDAEECCHFFVPTKENPCIISLTAIEEVGVVTIRRCLAVLQAKARKHNGIDALQVFESPDQQQKLWFHQDGSNGVISVDGFQLVPQLPISPSISQFVRKWTHRLRQSFVLAYEPDAPSYRRPRFEPPGKLFDLTVIIVTVMVGCLANF